MMAAVVWLSLGVLSAGAQTTAPLIITINGDLWRWDGAPNVPPAAITTWGWNEPGVLARDNVRIAYNSLAQVVADAYRRGAASPGGAVPSNIWVIDSFGLSGIRVAEQPADAAFFSEGLPDKGVVRATPAWSPDGTRLAWTEQTYPEGVGSVVLYDVASGVTLTIASNLPSSPIPRSVQWGTEVIAVRQDVGGADSYSIFAADGSPITSFTAGGAGRQPVYHALMQAAGREMLGVLFNDGLWELFDPYSGSSQVANGIPELYSLSAGQTSLALSPIINDLGGFTWRVLAPDGAQLAEFMSAPYFVPQLYALDPTGQAVAYMDYLEANGTFSNQVNVWQNGAITVVPNPPVGFPQVSGMLWGAAGWRVRVGVG
jgi:hypothetical protein